MIYKQKLITLMTIFSLMSVGWGQDCIDGIEVELWGECYNIEETTQLDLSNNGLTGLIPESICNLLIEWGEGESPNGDDWIENFNITNNQLCPPYPECIEEYIGSQDISNCWSCEDENVVELWGTCYSVEYVTNLSLSGNELSGEIPPEIGQLTNLNVLYLYSNQLTGEIPSEIGNLTNLEELFISNNQQLTGEIPSEIGTLTNLTYLNLSNNELSGEIPIEIGNLTNVTNLSLSGNELSGEIPIEIGNLTNVFWLDLSDNQLTGEIPENIWNISNLSRFKLHNNQINGIISDNICSSNLFWDNTHLSQSSSLNNNQLCPPYPECIEEYIGSQDISNCWSCEDENVVELWGTCYSVEYVTNLSLSGNELSGEIPPEIGNLTNLTNLGLSNNELSGEIPIEIGNLINLTSLDLHNNQFSGEIPDSLGNLINLIELNLSENQLSGELSEQFIDLNNLIYLNVSFNEFSGEILTFIHNNNLTTLLLNENLFTGLISNNICDLSIDWSNNNSFNISNNIFSPSYPQCIMDFLGEQEHIEIENNWYFNLDLGVLQYFIDNSVLSINYNLDLNLNGVIETLELGLQEWENGRLIYLNCYNDGLSGLIPDSFDNLTKLEILIFSMNQLEGNIPNTICNIENLELINLSNNKFCPPYPDCLSDEEIGYQDTSECSELSNLEISYPTEYSLNKSYPNPFNPTISIPFSVPSYNLVSINIYDLKGGLVTTLVEDNYSTGNHIIHWDGSNYSSGSYIVKMESGDYSSSQIITLVK